MNGINTHKEEVPQNCVSLSTSKTKRAGGRFGGDSCCGSSNGLSKYDFNECLISVITETVHTAIKNVNSTDTSNSQWI